MIRRLLIRSTIVWLCALAFVVLGQNIPINAAPAFIQTGASVHTVEQADAPPAIAQAPSSTHTPTPQSTLAAPGGLISPTLTLTPTETITVTGTVTGTATTTATAIETPGTGESEQPPVRRTTVVTSQQIPSLNATPTPTATTTPTATAPGTTAPVTTTPVVTGDEEDDIETGEEALEDEALVEPEEETDEIAEPLVGTIVTNHSDHTSRFFIEGQTIELAASRATSFDLPRGTTVLNLYNCAASTPESNEDCYWDPYILQRDGFYEIYQSRSAGVDAVARLLLRAADSPPSDQVWIQNRTGNVESIVYRNEVVELIPATVHEFPVNPGSPAILYVRSCIVLDDQSACEWSPKTLEAGIYYALSQVETAGGLANSTVIDIELRPVIGGSNEETDAEIAPANDQVVCYVQVPTLNIRSGPGLQYEIIGKIFSNENEPDDVVVVGRDATNQWLVVEPQVMPDGWITASESFVVCEGDFTQLPLVEAPPLPVAPTPPAAAVTPEEAPNQQPADEVDAESEAATEEEIGAPDEDETDDPEGEQEMPPADLPEGYALLLVHNGFEHIVRFTLDQQYRVDAAPSEIDLQPGQSTNIIVYPGSITFSVSTPWRGLSGNALIQVEADTTQELWLRFESDGPESWLLNW